jgi:hypothetical protein
VTLTRETVLELAADRAALDPEPRPRTLPASPDELLTARAAAARLGVSPRYLYAHRREFPFTRELPGGPIRFSAQGLARWLAREGLAFRNTEP